jgi:2-methylfumaryl-CoA isomerase
MAAELGADFTDEGQRYTHRDALSGLFREWFGRHTAEQCAAALAASSVLWERYRTFAEAAVSDKVTDNAMFAPLDQPRIGEYLAPGLPLSIGGVYPPAEVAPALGDHTAAVLSEWLALSPEEIDRLIASDTVA